MPHQHPIAEDHLRASLAHALGEVFSKLLARNISALPPTIVPTVWESLAPSEPNQPDVARVIGSVGFSGEVAGLLQLQFDLEFARACTAELHGRKLTDLESDCDERINDAIGEITGMTAGCFRNKLCGDDVSYRLGLPSIMRGNTIRIESISSVRHHHSEYDVCGGIIVADVFIQERHP